MTEQVNLEMAEQIIRRFLTVYGLDAPSNLSNLVGNAPTNAPKFASWALKCAKDHNFCTEQTVACLLAIGLEAILAADQNTDVRRYVAGNTSTSVETLAILAADQDADVRRYVTSNVS